ncbi:hypothetical protein CPB85DRAFT_1431673 [Mucidula mucida]|nr:hypothetical protein CPB85DRAFT_1431673 [Mucidula mucida]
MVSPAQADKRLLWDPRQGNKFIVGGRSQLTLYEWTPEYPEIRHITSKHGLEHMKCFAWSPDHYFDDLIAVGYSTGRLDLIRLEASKHARQSNLLSTGPSVSLPLRNYRSCNALSFCPADPNYLAVGLDKTQPSLPHAELGPKVDRRIVQQHAPTEVVSALTFLPHCTNLVLASISSRWLRLFDLRTPGPAVFNVGLKVSGMATDPFDPRRVACFGEGLITLWDTRKLVQPILSFSEKDAVGEGASSQSLPGIYSSVEFSSTRRGVLATLHQGARHVRMWDMMEARAHVVSDTSSETEKSRDSAPSHRLAKRSWANLPWSGGPSGNDSFKEHPPSVDTSIILSDTRRTKTFDRPLSSFALVPPPQEQPSILTTSIMVVNGEGDLELHSLYDTPKQTCWSARGDLAMGAGFSFRVIYTVADQEVPEPWDLPQALTQPTRSATTSRSRGREKRRSPDPNASFTPPLYNHREDESPVGSGSRGVSIALATNLATTRPDKRSFSPASLRVHESQINAGSPLLKRSISRPRQDPISVKAKSSLSPDTRNAGPSKIRKTPLKGVAATVEDDISMVMRRRVISGYGIKNPDENGAIVQNGTDTYDSSAQILSDLWGWISYSRNILCNPTPMINGYDFSYEGLLSIWEGMEPRFSAPPVHHTLLEPPANDTLLSGRRSRSPAGESHGNFSAALKELLSRGSIETAWTPAATTSRQLQRQVALQLIGWSLRDSELQKDIDRWESNGKISRAACWLVFIKQYGKAVRLLLASEDESHHMMSGMLAALTAHHTESRSSGIRSSDLREHCERVIVKLQDPYLRAMLTHLALGDWSEVLEEELIPFRERLAIAFQFLDDKTLSSYLRRVKDRTNGGDIDAIIVTGLTKAGMNILQSYVDKSGDIQTAAIMASYVCPSKFTDARVDRWLDAYRDLLDGFRLFHHRVDFDVTRGQIVQEFVDDGYNPPEVWAPRQILIRCNYCNKTISDDGSEIRRTKATSCPHCSRSLPRCSVCLMTLSVIPDAAREVELAHTSAQYADTIDDAIVICQTCRHGGHASHVMDWFFDGDGTQSHATCAVANCDCQCADNM